MLVANGCGSGEIDDDEDAGELDADVRDVPALPDVPAIDAPRCRPAMETCNRRDDDCDERVDEGFDTTRDPSNCGACGIRCSASTPECVPSPAGGGTCLAPCADPEPTRCGLACVDTTASLAHCGSCGNACPVPPSASATCTASACGFSCASGFGDCDANAGNGCETPLNTLTDCGSCGTGCSRSHASESCSTGSCQLGSCSSGYRNCDGVDSNGCETDVETLSNCGACGVTCSLANATETCSTGSCRIATCNAGFNDCNGVASDGCECVVL